MSKWSIGKKPCLEALFFSSLTTPFTSSFVTLDKPFLIWQLPHPELDVFIESHIESMNSSVKVLVNVTPDPNFQQTQRQVVAPSRQWRAHLRECGLPLAVICVQGLHRLATAGSQLATRRVKEPSSKGTYHNREHSRG